MKILKANIMFVLPDGFDGDINEALELWALHRDHAPLVDEEPAELGVSSRSLLANAALGFRAVHDVSIWQKSADQWRPVFETGTQAR